MWRHRRSMSVAAISAMSLLAVGTFTLIGACEGGSALLSTGAENPAGATVLAQLALGEEVIDFETLSAGAIIDEVQSSNGVGPVTVKGFNPDLGAAVNAAVVFDSANPPGLDFDLGTPNEDFGGPGVGSGGETGSPHENNTAQGKVAIVAANVNDGDGDMLVDVPNDADGVGSAIEFNFAALGTVTVKRMLIIDVEQEEEAATVELFDGDDNLLNSFTLPQVGNNGVATADLGAASGVVRMVVTLNGSGAIDDIVFEVDGVCGDGNLDPGEECDDGNDVNEDGCRNDCTLPFCGDGVVDDGEECDDGNDVDDDTCRNDCTLPSCGDGIVDDGEACDDGNDINDDGCRNDCTLPFCGDGIVDDGEECDDGNNNDYDGCSAECEVETGTQGCTLGYWKNHLDSWAATGYGPNDTLGSVFHVPASFSSLADDTLLDALRYSGGPATIDKARLLLKQAVAALLSAAHPDVSYGMASPADAVDAVNEALATESKGPIQSLQGELDDLNNAGCPLN